MIKYAIIEDNPFAMEHLHQTIKRLRRDYELVFKASSVKETVDFIRSNPDIDLFFMDIELTDGKCFAIFDQVTTTTPIIFTTAYDEFAIQAFKVNGMDYLLKPISEQELAYAIDKYEHLNSSRSQGTESSDDQAQNAAAPTSRILTVSGEKYSYLNISEIAYFMSEDNYAFAYLHTGGRKLINITSLSQLEGSLPPDRFFRLSRNIIASIESIHSVSKFLRGRLFIILKAGNEKRETTVSASNRDSFLEWLGK